MSTWVKDCKCPINEKMNYEELVKAANLYGRKNEIKNCCEHLGYICPNLDRLLRRAELDRSRKKYVQKKKEVKQEKETYVKLKIRPDFQPAKLFA